jgi:predicted nucleic acid-binding protein
MRYFDASALVKCYAREPESARVERLLSSTAGATSRLSAVEVTSALTRRARSGACSSRDLNRMLHSFDDDLSRLSIVELSEEVVVRARGLLERHPLRAGDAIQLASCLVLQEGIHADVSFTAFDERLSKAARAEGVLLDP